MAVKIDQKIVSVEVVKDEVLLNEIKTKNELQLNQYNLLARPLELKGSTYKLKPGNSDHSIYLTINDIWVNGELRPYEIFINTKNPFSVQWTNVFTRLVSAVFRREANNLKWNGAFLIEELLSVYDHSDMFFNGQYTKHPINMPSTVAYIGYAIRKHLNLIGLFPLEEDNINNSNSHQDQLKNAEICPKCGQKTYVKTDCWICLECSYSKCG